MTAIFFYLEKFLDQVVEMFLFSNNSQFCHSKMNVLGSDYLQNE